MYEGILSPNDFVSRHLRHFVCLRSRFSDLLRSWIAIGKNCKKRNDFANGVAVELLEDLRDLEFIYKKYYKGIGQTKRRNIAMAAAKISDPVFHSADELEHEWFKIPVTRR